MNYVFLFCCPAIFDNRSLHPNGTTLATSGNDGAVRLFDVRKFRDSRNSSKAPKALATQIAGLSISSSFFSPSGKSLLTTSFANRLDLTDDAHLVSGGKTIKPDHSIRHNNQTGTFNTPLVIVGFSIQIHVDKHLQNFFVPLQTLNCRTLVDNIPGNLASGIGYLLFRKYE